LSASTGILAESRSRVAQHHADAVEEILARHGHRHVGVIAGTLAGDERRVLVRGHVSPNSIFEIGSITKVFTALLLARMAQDGRVELGDRPTRCRPITLADLACHTAGLPRLPKGFLIRGLRHPRDPYAQFGAPELEHALRVVHLRSQGRVRYSNLGAGVLGYLLSLRQGVSYGDLIAQEICAPLRLDDTFLAVPEDKRGRFVDGHDRRGRRVPHWHFDALAGAGGLRSTAADLLTFLALQIDPPDSPLGAAARLTHVPRARRGRLRVGLGWLHTSLNGDDEDLIWHNGGTGGFRSFVGFMPDSKVGVVVLSNCARRTDAIGMLALEALRSQ
jgi:CubicO group peptidase (beta-lactamase class C family)